MQAIKFQNTLHDTWLIQIIASFIRTVISNGKQAGI